MSERHDEARTLRSPVAGAPMVRLAAGFALVLGVAFVLRARGLQLVPVVTDESEEVRFAWDIAFDGSRPLTHTDAYNGPLWPYLMAASLRVAGPSVELPRSFTLAFGLGAVTVTFALGALLAEPERRATGATIAGLLAATCFTAVLVSSRVAWSNSTTPFWTTLASLLLVLSVRQPESAARWLAAGVVSGLALHTHPSVAAFLAGLAAWLILAPERRDLLRGPGPWIALAGFLVAYLPVIAYNLAGPADTLAQAAASRNVETDLGPVSYTVNLAQSLAQLGRSLAGGFDGHEQPIWGTGALLVALVALSLTVLAGLARQPEVTGRRLPAVVSVVTLLLLPAVNQNWYGFLEARYLGLLAPLVAVAGGVATTAATDPARRAAAIAAGLLIAVSGARSWRHVDAALSAGNPIAEMLEVVAIAGRTSSGDGGGSAGSTQDEDAPAPILVAEELEDLRWPHRGDPARAITYYLTLAGVPYEAESLERIGQLVAHDAARAVIAARPDADALRLAPMVTVREEGIGEWGIYSMASGAPRGPATTP